MEEADPATTPQLRLQTMQLVYGVFGGLRERIQPFTDPDKVNGALGQTALEAGLALGLSVGLTRLAYAAPKVTAVISKGFKYGFLADVAVLGAQAAYDQIDTYLHPENFSRNSSAEANTLGSAEFDFAAVGTGSALGFGVGERLFGLSGAVRSISSRGVSDGVLSLQYRPLRHISISADEPNTSHAAQLYNEVQNSVVKLNNGSGFIVDGEEGYIATNNHVSQGILKPTAKTSDGQKFELKLIARDRDADIAFYKTATRPETPLAQVRLAESSALTAGDPLYPVGHPLNARQSYVAKLTMDTHMMPPSITPPRVTIRPAAYIEGTGPTLPGMSGSAYFNEEREVVGQVARYDKELNKSFGASVEHLNEVLRQVRAHEPYEGWLEIKSQVETFKNASGEDEIAKPIKVTSTAALRNREQLAQKAAVLFRPINHHYPRSTDLGSYRSLGSATSVLLGHSTTKFLLPDTNENGKESGH